MQVFRISVESRGGTVLNQLMIIPKLMEDIGWSVSEREAERVMKKYYIDRIPLPQKKLSDIIDTIFKSEYKHYFVNSMEQMQVDKIYQSSIHGQDHIERVCIFTAYLAACARVHEHTFYLCMECAKYHDIGRCDDSEDRMHGQRGAEKIHECCRDFGEYDCEMIAAIVEAHSLLDEEAKNVFLKYQLLKTLDYEMYLQILYILKDADALDRFRLTEHSLKVEFLRIPESIKLVQVACALYRVSIK